MKKVLFCMAALMLTAAVGTSFAQVSKEKATSTGCHEMKDHHTMCPMQAMIPLA